MQDTSKPLTTGTVAHYCGVSRMGVIRWIRDGKLKAFSTPGGHYRIRVDDFRDFLERFDMPLDSSLFPKESNRVLVVASDASRLGLIVKALSDMPEDYTIDVALDGASALAKIAEDRPALAILDATAPEIYATKLVQQINEKWDGRAPAMLTVAPPAAVESLRRELGTGSPHSRVKQAFIEPSALEMQALQSEVHRLLNS